MVTVGGGRRRSVTHNTHTAYSAMFGGRWGGGDIVDYSPSGARFLAPEYACKCFFNHSAAMDPGWAPTPAPVNGSAPGPPPEPGDGGLAPLIQQVISYYFSVVDLSTGLRVPALRGPNGTIGANCPTHPVALVHGVAADSTSPTGYFCGCPDPAVATSSSFLTVPAIGVLVSIVGAVLSSLGQVGMKWVHTHNELRPLKERRAYFLNPRWYAGFFVYIFSQALTVVAFASVSQGENAVIGTFSLAANSIFARHFLGEVMTPLHWVGMLLIAGGATMVLVSTLGVKCSNSPEAIQEIAAALSPTQNAPFFIFMVLLIATVLGALTVRRVGQWRQSGGEWWSCSRDDGEYDWFDTFGSRRPPTTGSQPLLDPMTAKSESETSSTAAFRAGNGGGDDRGAGGIRGPHTSRKRRGRKRHRHLSRHQKPQRRLGFGEEHYSDRAMLFVTIATTMGCMSSFCASATVKLVTMHLHSFGQSLGPWIVLAVFIVAIVGSMHYLNRGLESGQALLVVPGFFVGNTMLAMVCSLLYQRTYMYLTSLEIILFTVGTLTAIAGVVAMVWKEMRNDPDRMELWAQRVASSPRGRERAGNFGTGSMASLVGDGVGDHLASGGAGTGGTGGGVANPYAPVVSSPPRRIGRRGGGGGGGGSSSGPRDWIDPEAPSPSPSPSLGTSINSTGSRVSSQGGSKSAPRSFYAPIAVGPDAVDALSNQGNQQVQPYSHQVAWEEDSGSSDEGDSV